jgi:hypothetical protein
MVFHLPDAFRFAATRYFVPAAPRFLNARLLGLP